MSKTREAMVRRHFAAQAKACRELGSPFTAQLLDLALSRLRRGDRVGEAVLGWPGDPVADALALRLAGALHALVLSGTDHVLASLYPPAEADEAALSEAVAAALSTHAAFVCAWLERPPQTNEVARATALLGGYVAIAARTRRPLAISEIGASAGLNLLWDRFHYTFGGEQWGNPAATVRLAPRWEGQPFDRSIAVEIADRRGCDLNPLDPSRPKDRLRLLSYVWTDQTERKARLAAALDLAASDPAPVDRADAADWLAQRLSSAPAGATRVVAHTIVWQYLSGSTRERITELLDTAGAAATTERPLAWLRLEPNAEQPDEAALSLTLWPGGRTLQLARADYHGRWIRWDPREPSA